MTSRLVLPFLAVTFACGGSTFPQPPRADQPITNYEQYSSQRHELFRYLVDATAASGDDCTKFAKIDMAYVMARLGTFNAYEKAHPADLERALGQNDIQALAQFERLGDKCENPNKTAPKVTSDEDYKKRVLAMTAKVTASIRANVPNNCAAILAEDRRAEGEWNAFRDYEANHIEEVYKRFPVELAARDDAQSYALNKCDKAYVGERIDELVTRIGEITTSAAGDCATFRQGVMKLELQFWPDTIKELRGLLAGDRKYGKTSEPRQVQTLAAFDERTTTCQLAYNQPRDDAEFVTRTKLVLSDLQAIANIAGKDCERLERDFDVIYLAPVFSSVSNYKPTNHAATDVIASELFGVMQRHRETCAKP